MDAKDSRPSVLEHVIIDILKTHDIFPAFAEHPNDGTVWSVEILPSEGSQAFSRPLVIAREGNIISLAHYTISTYDIDYDPLMEFSIPEGQSLIPETGSRWQLLSIYAFHSGLWEAAGSEQESAWATERVRQWAEHLEEAGYLSKDNGRVHFLSPPPPPPPHPPTDSNRTSQGPKL
ncbi:hypothetical protein DFS34DRAFT_631273 [Phlyctochytrium arcticum]|nr:hypothetical protein DFS34DRAFT_631273 [Phlyctochytrium arcticum]